MEFLETIEAVEAADADINRLFGDAGARIRGRAQSADYRRKLGETVRFMADVSDGRRPIYHLRAAMATADFPNLFGDVLDRQLLARYAEFRPSYPLYARIDRTIPDFRTVKRFAVDGSESVLSAVGQLEEYPESKLSDTAYSYSVGKYGRKAPFTWETFINDDLAAFRDFPDRLARAARRSEEKFATQLYVDTNGPHASMFTAGNKNIVNPTNSGAPFTVVNPPLSIQALQQAYAVLAKQVDAEGEPIAIDGVVLVVPPGLQTLAENILSATEIWITGDQGGGTTNQQIHTTNWMARKTRLAVNAYIPVVATTNGNTSWFLFADPGSSRPAIEVGFLRGHDTPEIFMKEADAVRVGGGSANPADGDFDLDAVQYKIRHVFGGTRLDPKAAVSSNGSSA